MLIILREQFSDGPGPASPALSADALPTAPPRQIIGHQPIILLLVYFHYPVIRLGGAVGNAPALPIPGPGENFSLKIIF